MGFKFPTTMTLPITGLLVALLLAACQPIQAPTPAAAGASDIPAVEANRQLLARWLHIDPATVAVVSAEAVEWPDACLGVKLSTELCAAMITPGYKASYRVDGQGYVLHMDQGGYAVRVAAAPEPNPGELILAWGDTVDNGSCTESIIGMEGVAFGLCGGKPRIGGHFAAAARKRVLTEWVNQFSAFDAETDFGSIRFVGQGAAVASPAEQERIGRWAKLVTMEAAGGESLASLYYQGPPEMGSPDTSKCAVLQVGTPTAVGLGACDGTMTNVELGERAYAEWEHLRDHFAPFVYETATERLTFEGMGTIESAAWQRAILAWARLRHAELASGQTSATAATALRWQLGPDPSDASVCPQLIVLRHGYGYAETVPCTGGDVIETTGDWLTNAELAAFDRWLYERAPLTIDQNYIDGQGSQAVSEAELPEIGIWAMDVRARLAGVDGSALPPETLARCPQERANLTLVVQAKRGYCLLMPTGYTLFAPNPNEVVIAQGSLMNHTEPRAAIVVIDAEGQNVEQIADRIVAEYQGFAVERNTIEFAGQPAVVLDNLPGQNLVRRVLMVYGDKLFDLTFTPADHGQMGLLYEAIVGNLTLLETGE